MHVSMNNRLGSRDRRHLNILVGQVDGQDLLFEFAGKSIPGVVVVLKDEYDKNGKWSSTSWEVEMAEGIGHFVWRQDWGTGAWVAAGTWDRLTQDVRELTRLPQLQAAAVARFVRARFPAEAQRLDAAEMDRQASPTEALLELLVAQKELAAAQMEAAEVEADVRRLEQAEQARQEAAALRERTGKAKEAMKRGASLADLKALLGG